MVRADLFRALLEEEVEMKKETRRLIGLRRKDQKGFTLLEYAAGAAVIAGVAYSALTVFGVGLTNFYTGLGNWASNQVSNLPDGNQQ